MTVLNYKKHKIPKDAIWIIRPSIFGNPFHISSEITREQAIKNYKLYLWAKINMGDMPIYKLAKLYEKDLVCCCVPQDCHGHVLEKAAIWAHKQLFG